MKYLANISEDISTHPSCWHNE